MVQAVLDRGSTGADTSSPSYRPAGISEQAFTTMISQIQSEQRVDDHELEEEGLVRHFVVTGDTLVSLSVKYGTTPIEITRLNQLLSGNIFSRQYVIVPRPENYTPDEPEGLSVAMLVAMRKRKLAIALRDKIKDTLNRILEMDEAVTYLHLTDYDVNLSFLKFKSDVAWEARHVRAVWHISFPRPRFRPFACFSLSRVCI